MKMMFLYCDTRLGPNKLAFGCLFAGNQTDSNINRIDANAK